MIDLKSELGLKVIFEIVWNIFICLVCFFIVWPIVQAVSDYPFLWVNIAFIIIFLSFSRYIFFLKYTYLSKSYIYKLLLLTISGLLFFLLFYSFTNFRNFMDEQGLQSLFEHLSAEENFKLTRYVKGETIFFGVGSILVSAMLPVRLLISVWRQYNNKPTE